MVFWSIPKRPAVAPYSGAILLIVARSASERLCAPSPWKITALSTTPTLRSISVDAQCKIGGRDAFTELVVQAHPYGVRNDERERLAQHGGLGFDSAHAVGDDPQSTGHGRVAVSADQITRRQDDAAAVVVHLLDHGAQP